MICLAQVEILAASSRQTCSEFSPNKRPAHRDEPADNPYAEDQKRRVDTVRHFGRISEDSRAHDAAHYDHSGIEQSQLTAGFRCVQC